MVDHIDLSGTHHHDHNTDGTGNCCYLDNWTYHDYIHGNYSAMTMASASKLAIIITLLIVSMWVMI